MSYVMMTESGLCNYIQGGSVEERRLVSGIPGARQRHRLQSQRRHGYVELARGTPHFLQKGGLQTGGLCVATPEDSGLHAKHGPRG